MYKVMWNVCKHPQLLIMIYTLYVHMYVYTKITNWSKLHVVVYMYVKQYGLLTCTCTVYAPPPPYMLAHCLISVLIFTYSVF